MDFIFISAGDEQSLIQGFLLLAEMQSMKEYSMTHMQGMI